MKDSFAGELELRTLYHCSSALAWPVSLNFVIYFMWYYIYYELNRSLLFLIILVHMCKLCLRGSITACYGDFGCCGEIGPLDM